MRKTKWKYSTKFRGKINLETGMNTKMLVTMKTKFDYMLDHIDHTQNDDNNPRRK